MSIRHTDTRNVALFDSVTGIAFGPVFEDDAEADAFERWIEHNGWKEGTPTDPRYWDKSQQVDMSTAWTTFLTTHTEAECPFDIDRDSYGLGFTGDSDKSRGDYVEATPDACGCECHKQAGGVFAAGRRS